MVKHCIFPLLCAALILCFAAGFFVVNVALLKPCFELGATIKVAEKLTKLDNVSTPTASNPSLHHKAGIIKLNNTDKKSIKLIGGNIVTAAKLDHNALTLTCSLKLAVFLDVLFYVFIVLLYWALRPVDVNNNIARKNSTRKSVESLFPESESRC